MSDPTQTATKLKQKTFTQDQRNMCYSLVLIVMELVAWSHASLDNSENVKCLPPTNFTIYEKHGKTFFSWSEFKEKDMDCNVTYKLQYRYLDTGNFSEIETEKTHYRKFLEFHKGVQARVKTVLQSATGEFTASDWTVANFTLSKGNFKVLVKNISCSVYNFDHFKCTWKEEDEMLTHAQYSVTLLYKSDGKFENRTCDTFTNKEEKVVGCHSRISSADPRIYLRINASGTDFYKIHIFRFLPRDIEKMDPPQNIKASIESGSLKIKWNQPRVLSITYNNSECFQYELKLNDSKNVQIQTIHERTSYNVSIIDAMRTYLLQLRGKKSDMCYTNNIWSDWSTIVVLNPNEGRNKLNSLVIALIVLGIPSVLLAVLLIFRCQRVLEKLFPPIPSPIIKNKNVLEKDTFFKTEAPKYIEEITIVVEDSSGDDRL